MKKENRLKKWVAACLCGAMLCTGVVGCTQLDLPKQGINFVTIEDGTVQPEQLTALADFSYELFRQTAAIEHENLLLSPLSAWAALSMTAQGADGDTADAFAGYFQGMSAEHQKILAAWLIQRMTDGETDVDMENSIWCDDEMTADEAFVDTVQQYYRAEVIEQDLQAGNAVRRVNNWIADATDDRIEKMLNEIDKDAVMLLINTLTFDADWQWQFSANSTGKRPFYLADGSEKTMDFMFQSYSNADYLNWDGGSGMMLPYKGGEYAMVVLLPDESSDYDAVLQQLSAEWVNKLLASKGPQTMVDLSIPKFEMASRMDLNDVCKAMGLGIAFDLQNADLSKLGITASGRPVFISRVLQNCVLKVSEKGTEAAAATVVEAADGAAMPMTEPVRLQLDRPFVYLIMDTRTQIPLFTGVYQGE